jgi:MoaA/NifB/PqqE/SkfB family radical SAM enzyme
MICLSPIGDWLYVVQRGAKRHDAEIFRYAVALQKRKPPLKLLHLEIHLAEHCNFGCASCNHFSPLAQKSFPDISEFERDVRRMGELFGGRARYISLLGGEPLLNSFERTRRSLSEWALP